eukprot:8750903-Pyramimonas_sp.AAC.1
MVGTVREGGDAAEGDWEGSAVLQVQASAQGEQVYHHDEDGLHQTNGSGSASNLGGGDRGRGRRVPA